MDPRAQSGGTGRVQAGPHRIRGHGLDTCLRRPRGGRNTPPAHRRGLEPFVDPLEPRRQRDLLHFVPGGGLGPTRALAGIRDLRGGGGHRGHPAADAPARPGQRSGPLARWFADRPYGHWRAPRHLPQREDPCHEPGRVGLAGHLGGLRSPGRADDVGTGWRRALLRRQPGRVQAASLRLAGPRSQRTHVGQTHVLDVLLFRGRHRRRGNLGCPRGGGHLPLQSHPSGGRGAPDRSKYGCAGPCRIGRGRGGVVRLLGRLPHPGLDREAAGLRPGREVSAHAGDPRRPPRHVQRELQLRLPGTRIERLRGPVHQSARLEPAMARSSPTRSTTTTRAPTSPTS